MGLLAGLLQYIVSRSQRHGLSPLSFWAHCISGLTVTNGSVPEGQGGLLPRVPTIFAKKYFHDLSMTIYQFSMTISLFKFCMRNIWQKMSENEDFFNQG